MISRQDILPLSTYSYVKKTGGLCSGGPALFCKNDKAWCPTNCIGSHWFIASGYNIKNKHYLEGWISLENLKFNTGPAPEIVDSTGRVNSLLCLQVTPFNGTPYGVSNATYYNLHRDEYEGWIELESIPYPQFSILQQIVILELREFIIE